MLALLNDWQRGFPLVERPFAAVGARHGLDEVATLQHFREALQAGRLARVGGVFAAGAGGAGVLAAMAVPAARLEAVAACVSAHPGVNHNYEREHTFNLWFVLNAGSEAAVQCALDGLQAATALPVLRLPMERAYRIDLGFDLRQPHARIDVPAPSAPAAVPADAWPLAARVEAGLPLVARPYTAWARELGCSTPAVLATLARWLADGTLKRLGAVLRHHEFGFAANAMVVFDVPDAEVDSLGARLARDARVTLAYRRRRAPGWPYNLFCMLHGRDRAAVQADIDHMAHACGLAGLPQAVLFSRRRFKQTGPRRFNVEPETRHAA